MLRGKEGKVIRLPGVGIDRPCLGLFFIVFFWEGLSAGGDGWIGQEEGNRKRAFSLFTLDLG